MTKNKITNNKGDGIKKNVITTKAARDRELTTPAQRVSGKLRLSERFKAWASLFLDQSNREYWGNATKCALKVYDTDNYHSAGQIGYENLKKLEKVAAMALEKEDFSFGRLMRIGAQKMEEGSYDDWEKFMELIGYFPRKSKGE